MTEAVKEPKGSLNVKAGLPSKAVVDSTRTAPLVYIVDDEPLVGGVVETILQMDGFQTQYFQSPEAALIAFEKASPRPHLIVTDFVMGAVNGMELIEQFLRLDPFVKTVLYSGNVGEEIMRDYLVQPDRFVPKPFHPKQLSDVVSDLLST